MTVRVRIWLRKKAALYTITSRSFKHLAPPGRGGRLDPPHDAPPEPASTSWRSDSAGSVTIKTPAEQETMRVAGRLAADVLDMIGAARRARASPPTSSTASATTTSSNVQQAIPAPLGYRGFPKSICTSVNHVVCHGIPSDRRLKQGDIVNIDVTVIKDGFHGDTSRMFAVGKRPAARRSG